MNAPSSSFEAFWLEIVAKSNIDPNSDQSKHLKRVMQATWVQCQNEIKRAVQLNNTKSGKISINKVIKIIDGI